MDKCRVTGVDVVPDERVPDNEIWLDAPGPHGRRIRYIIDASVLTESNAAPVRRCTKCGYPTAVHPRSGRCEVPE